VRTLAAAASFCCLARALFVHGRTRTGELQELVDHRRPYDGDRVHDS